MGWVSDFSSMEVELMVPERIVEREGILGAGEALDGDQGVPVVRAHVWGAAGHVCDLLQRLFLFLTHVVNHTKY